VSGLIAAGDDAGIMVALVSEEAIEVQRKIIELSNANKRCPRDYLKRKVSFLVRVFVTAETKSKNEVIR